MEKLKLLYERLTASDKFWAAALLIITFAVFAPSLTGNILVSDDTVYFSNVRNISSSLKYCFVPVLGLNTPLTGFSLYLDYLIGGEEYFIFHARLTNILLHCCSALLVFILLRQLCRSAKAIPPACAAAAALVFAIHPQRVESVVWISERKDCLAMSLGLAALLLFFLALRKNKISIFSPILLVLSLCAKPMWIFFLVPATALIWNHLRFFSFKTYLKFLFPSLFIAAGTAGIHLISISGAVQNTWSQKDSVSLFLKLEIICHNYGNYFLKTFIPGELFPLYPFYAPEGIQRLIALIPLCLLFFCFYMYKKHRSVFLHGILPVLVCYIVSLLPVVGFIKIGNADFADRYSYMPSLFLWTGTMFAVWAFSEKVSFKKMLIPAVCAYIIFLLVQTSFYIPVWNDHTKMTNLLLRPQLPNTSAAVVHAVNLYDARNFDEMFKFINARLSERPHYSPSHNHMIRLFKISATGLALIKCGRIEEGMRHLNIIYSISGNGVIRNFPISFLQDLFSTGAEYYLKQQKNPEAAAAIYKGGAVILRQYSREHEHYYNAAAALILKDYDRAARLLLQCLAMNPSEKKYLTIYDHAEKMKKASEHGTAKQ